MRYSFLTSINVAAALTSDEDCRTETAGTINHLFSIQSGACFPSCSSSINAYARAHAHYYQNARACSRPRVFLQRVRGNIELHNGGEHAQDLKDLTISCHGTSQGPPSVTLVHTRSDDSSLQRYSISLHTAEPKIYQCDWEPSIASCYSAQQDDLLAVIHARDSLSRMNSCFLFSRENRIES